MLQEGIEWFGQASADVVVSVHVPLPNEAAFVSQSMPAEMFAGRQYGVTAVMRNVGTNAWTSAGAYRLGATNPQGNTLWGLGRVELPAAVPPGGEVIFNFAVTAPPNPGTYDLQWQMVQDGVEWFGDTTANRSVHVVEAPPPSVSIRDVGVVEGNPAVFIVTLDWPSQQPITVHYATEDCSAGVSAADYQSTSGILTFDPNVTSRSVIVPTLTRAGDQGTRLFKLMLTTPVNATIADGSGQGIVRDSSPSGPLPPARADFNGDGKTDILWRDPSGNNQVWFMNDMERIGGVSLSPVADPNWKVAATADFNGDGRTDILWRNYSTGVNVVWFMDGSTLTGGAFLTPVTDTNWAVMGSGDFNGDGKADIVWRHQLSGDNQVWYLNGTDGTILGGDVLPSVAGVAWTIGAVGDFNGDGKPDIFWHYQAMAPGGNRVYQHGSKIWLMNGAAVVSEVVLGQLAPPWRVAASGDFTSDGRTDLLWQNETTGALLLWEMNGTTVSCQSSLSPDDHLPPELGWRMVGPR
jgi:hypothetical protein